MRKPVKIVLIAVSVLAVIFFSLKIEYLEEYKSKNTVEVFDAAKYAEHFWKEDLPKLKEKATDAESFILLLNDNPDEAFKKYGNVVGISKTYYFLLKGKGKISLVEDEYFVVDISENQSIQVATEFIFGNAVRDGSGKISIDEFLNMTDFNNVSVALNKLVKANVVKKLKSRAGVGKSVEFVGAAEISMENIETDKIRIIPVIAQIRNGKNE